MTLISTPFWSRSISPESAPFRSGNASSFDHYLRKSASYRAMVSETYQPAPVQMMTHLEAIRTMRVVMFQIPARHCAGRFLLASIGSYNSVPLRVKPVRGGHKSFQDGREKSAALRRCCKGRTVVPRIRPMLVSEDRLSSVSSRHFKRRMSTTRFERVVW